MPTNYQPVSIIPAELIAEAKDLCDIPEGGQWATRGAIGGHRYATSLEDAVRQCEEWGRADDVVEVLWAPPWCMFSEYNGTSLVEKANAQALQAELGEDDCWTYHNEGHGITAYVRVLRWEGDEWTGLGDDTQETLQDILRTLSDYPVLDDDLHSQLEQEEGSAQLLDWYRSDLHRECSEAQQDRLDAMSDDEFSEMACDIMEELGEWPWNEGGSTAVFPSGLADAIKARLSA